MSASQSKAQTEHDVRLPGEDLTIEETLRVMDVAREMRDQRQTAEEMFQRDSVRRGLREKLMSQAEMLGEDVTEEEIDAAIDQYLSKLHLYQDPPRGFKSFLAHCWVRRRKILGAVAAVAVAAVSIWLLLAAISWFLFSSPIAPLNPQLRKERAVAAEVAQLGDVVEQIKSLTDDAEVISRAESLHNQTHAATDLTDALAAKTQLEELLTQLKSEYEVHVVAGTSEMSGFDRTLRGGETLYYAIVVARDADGKIIPQLIRNSETDRTEQVTKWAVEISAQAFERLKQDKRDGVLHETLYGVKKRGQIKPVIQMDGAVTDSPSTLTSWKFD